MLDKLKGNSCSPLFERMLLITVGVLVIFLSIVNLVTYSYVIENKILIEEQRKTLESMDAKITEMKNLFDSLYHYSEE